MFARQFKPKISTDSSEYMVEEYKRLRQRDSSGEWEGEGIAVVSVECRMRDEMVCTYMYM